jgi:hypothetical protein
MKTLFLTLLLATLCATGYGQTIKSLGFNTTNGKIGYAGTNPLTFTNTVFFGDDVSINPSAGINYGGSEVMNLEERTLVGDWAVAGGLGFFNATNAATTRTNLGLGATWLTNDNVTNFRTAIGLGASNSVSFNDLRIDELIVDGENGISFEDTNGQLNTRNNLGAARAPIWAYKATNQTNATTNLVSDTALTFEAAANTKYLVTANIGYQYDSGETMVGKFIIPTNATAHGRWNIYFGALGDYLFYPTEEPVTNEQEFIKNHDANVFIPQQFVVVTGTNGGSVTFQFASTNTNSVISSVGSYLKAEVIE